MATPGASPCRETSGALPLCPSARRGDDGSVAVELDPEGAHLAALRRVVDFRGARVVEVGCGDGRLTVGIAQDAASVFAFDPDEESVRRARATLPPELADRVMYAVASATEVEIARGAFDLVVFSWSL